MRKKALVYFLLACALLSGGIAALSVLPHAHGDDMDHSHHETCPVHQFSLGHASQEAAARPSVQAAAFIFLWFVLSGTAFCRDHRFVRAFGRAPPASP